MPPSKHLAPAAELQDAVSVFMKAASHALVSVEESSKEDLRRALQDAREAQKERDEMRRERDALLQEKLAAAVELEVAKCDSERWKAATEKAEWMINHQTETIAQLRRESQQWKDQFMRVDEERLRLSGRNDELVSQQLYANRRENTYHQEPLTPRSQGPQISGRATSSNQYASTSTSALGYATDGDILNRRTPRDQSYTNAQTPRAKSSRNANATGHAKSQPVASSSRRVSHSHSTTTPGKVLRTVHVVMQGGQVKEESLDSIALADPESNAGSESLGEEEEVEEEVQPPPNQPQKQKQKQVVGKRKATSKGQSARRKWSEDKRIYDDDEESGSEAASMENEDEYVPPAKSRVVEDEDEDELMLGGEVDRHETYGAEKISEARTPARRAQTQPAKQSSGSARKRNSPYPPSTSKTGSKSRRLR